MENENRENLHMSPSDSSQAVQQLAGEIARMKDSVERLNTETAKELARLETHQREHEVEHESELKPRKRTGAVLWAAVVLLAAGLIGISWYGYPLLQKHDSLLAQVPGLQESLNSVGKRIDSTEGKLRAWASERDIFGGRLTKLEKSVTANLQLARKESREMAAQVSQRFQTELDRRMEPMLSRLSRLESAQETEQARLGQLRDEIRDEVSGLRKETVQQIAQTRQDSSGDIASVSQAMAWNKRDLNDLAKQIDHDRVDFEVTKNQSRELIPGISLRVTHTNPSYQNVDGWLQLIPDGHTLWVRGQDIEQPVIFFTQRDKRPLELVFTRVTKDAVIGYLLVPAQTGSNNSASTAGDTQLSSSVVPPR